jgi:hypothetical protein
VFSLTPSRIGTIAWKQRTPSITITEYSLCCDVPTPERRYDGGADQGLPGERRQACGERSTAGREMQVSGRCRMLKLLTLSIK